MARKLRFSARLARDWFVGCRSSQSRPASLGGSTEGTCELPFKCGLSKADISVSVRTFARDYQAGPNSPFFAPKFRPPMNRLAFTLLLSLTLFGLLSSGGCEQTKSQKNSDTDNAANSMEVEVTVDFRNSKTEFAEPQPALTGKVKLPAGATAFSALEEFASQSGFSVQSTGAGETKFVMGIRDVVNLGAKGDNWTYQVNGQLGDRSAGIYPLKAGDKVSWIFGKYP